tara:strand:- start:529 stop:1035 length:507 start_codon:yes stop_codon:yes gene_type:complete
MYNNICLIGLPGSGKTNLGNQLFKYLKKGYINTNEMIQHKYNMPLNKVLYKYGTNDFIKIEADIINSIKCSNTIIVTGGSVIYNKDSMEHINYNLNSYTYHLFISKKQFLNRLKDKNYRNEIIINKDQSIDQLYNERIKLYGEYSHQIILGKENINLDLFKPEIRFLD